MQANAGTQFGGRTSLLDIRVSEWTTPEERDSLIATLTSEGQEALRRALIVVREAGGGPEHVGRLTIYVSDMDAYRDSLRDLGAVYRENMGRNYPAMALVEVSRLVERHAMVEIEATAVVPAGGSDGGG